MSRAFQSLQPDEVLSLAINVEIRNAQRYSAFSTLFAGYDDAVSALFAEMEREEIDHKEILEKLYSDRFGGPVRSVSESDVDEVVEAVDVDDAEHFIFDDMTRRAVLEAALRAENGAQKFYQSLLPDTRDAVMRQLYSQLAGFEEDHVAAIHRALKRLDATIGVQV